MPFSELRVHGVSGTPPRDMLYTDPVTYDLTDRMAKVYEPSRDRWKVRAFHWGSLTAGRWYTALWILLTPFAMANTSGWMASNPNQVGRAMGRLAGLSLTAIFFSQLAKMAIDVPYGVATDANEPMFWLFVALVGVTIFGLTYISTQSTFRRIPLSERLLLVFSPRITHMAPALFWPVGAPAEQWVDPARSASLLDPRLWGVHAFLHRLRRIHLTAGMSVLALTVGLGVSDMPLTVAAYVVGAVAALTLLFTTWAPASTPVLGVTALLPITGVIVVGWAAAVLRVTSLRPDDLGVSDDITLLSAIVLLVAGFVSLVAGWIGAGWGAFLEGLPGLGVIVIGGFIGASLGLTGALLVEDLLLGASTPVTDVVLGEGGAWTAVAMVVLVLVLAITTIAFGVTPLEAPDTLEGSEAVATESFFRRVVLRSRLLLGVAGAYGILAGITAALFACPGFVCDQDNLSVPDWAKENPSQMTQLVGLSFDLTSWVGLAKLGVVVVPAFLILRSIVGGLLNGESTRRQVSILWDIGSFWPRWHHPLGPPAYSPHAVTRLRAEVESLAPMVLSAHSQGSLIAAITLPTVVPTRRPGMFITYGSQLGILYPKLFPSVGFDELTASVDDLMDGRWINLWRRSDPIGGQLIADLAGRNWHVDSGAGHSRYELTPEYCTARKSLSRGSYDLPPRAEVESCWDRG